MFQPGYPDNPSIPEPPTPGNHVEASRWDETRRRRRMLEGTWRDDLCAVTPGVRCRSR